ncbi:MAG: hypothetical protein IKV60_03150, partial [Rikenellaceae bacterium]|nr:hypothetical protein [Rikenellaceae bacterium]
KPASEIPTPIPPCTIGRRAIISPIFNGFIIFLGFVLMIYFGVKIAQLDLFAGFLNKKVCLNVLFQADSFCV